MTESLLPLVHEGWAVLSSRDIGRDHRTVPTWSTGIDCGVGPARLALGDAGGRRLLIPIVDSLQISRDLGGEGLHINTSVLQIDSHWVRFLDIACDDSRLFAVFSTLLGEILARLTNGAAPLDAVISAVADYRELLRRRTENLSVEFLIGLAGELLLLKDLVSVSSLAISTWVGPLGARHDFMGQTSSIEVKSSLRSTSKLVHISAIDQLECSEKETLYLSWHRFEQSGQGGFSIVELIQSILAAPVDISLFVDRLGAVGLGDWRDRELLSSFRVRQVDSALYHVREGFPRIVSTSFSNDALPTGVVSCEYELDLNQATQFLLDADETSKAKTELVLWPTS